MINFKHKLKNCMKKCKNLFDYFIKDKLYSQISEAEILALTEQLNALKLSTTALAAEKIKHEESSKAFEVKFTESQAKCNEFETENHKL